MNDRRSFLLTLVISAGLLVSGMALAAPPTVEILAMSHPPVKVALQPLRDWLAAQGARLTLIETDIESPAGAKRLAALGLSGHIPIVILVDGQYRVKRPDGSTLELINFPNVPGTPPGARGQWTAADVQAVLTERMKKP